MRTLPACSALALALAGPLTLAASLRPDSSPAASAAELPMLFLWHGEVAADATGAQVTDVILRTAEYARVHYPDTQPRILLELNARPDSVYWFREHADYSARLQCEREMAADEKWSALDDEWFPLFDAESDSRIRLFPLGGAGRDDRTKPLRSLRITRSPFAQVPAARRFARRVVEYLEANYPAVDARAYVDEMKDPAAIYWMMDYESFNTWKSTRERLLEDDAYVEMFARAHELFLEEVEETTLMDF